MASCPLASAARRRSHYRVVGIRRGRFCARAQPRCCLVSFRSVLGHPGVASLLGHHRSDQVGISAPPCRRPRSRRNCRVRRDDQRGDARDVPLSREAFLAGEVSRDTAYSPVVFASVLICEVALYIAWRVLNALKPAVIRPVDHAIEAAEPADAAPSKPSKVRTWLGREEELGRAWVQGAPYASITEALRSKLPSLGVDRRDRADCGLPSYGRRHPYIGTAAGRGLCGGFDLAPPMGDCDGVHAAHRIEAEVRPRRSDCSYYRHCDCSAGIPAQRRGKGCADAAHTRPPSSCYSGPEATR
jgi:hypothetical protein